MKSQIQLPHQQYLMSLGKEHRELTKEEKKEYHRLADRYHYLKNKSILLTDAQKEKRRQRNRDNYRKKHPEIRYDGSAWKHLTDEQRREKRRQYSKNYTPTKKTQIGMKFRYWIHNAMKRKGESKTAWIDNVGCTKEEFKAHIESQFVEGMTWDNWTVDGWHIDHIIPLAAAGSNHYTNLQPLWWYDNLSKSDKLV